MHKKVALIATTYNCKNELNQALKVLVTSENLELLDEIVVVDGGSNDGTWQLLQQWGKNIDKFKPYKVDGANISKGRNEAIKRTDAEIIVTFDSGTRYCDDWLRFMIAPFETEGAEVVGGFTVSVGSTLFESCLAAFGSTKRSAYHPSARGCAYYKKIWEKIGGYPENVKAGEDTWFNTQWKKLGFKYVHARQAEQYWRVRENWKETFKMAYRNTKGHVALGEPAGSVTIALVTIVYLACIICLGLGLIDHRFWYLSVALLFANGIKRMLTKGRWKFFANPLKFLVGMYVLSAFDLGMMIGALKGIVRFAKDKMTSKGDSQ